MAKNTTHGLEPSTQSFETEIVWLYQRYKYRIPKNDPFKRAQYTIPTQILDLLITTFNITHSYFSSPITCPTQFTQFYSPFSRDIIFGSLGKMFDYKWQGTGYAHPHTSTDLQQAIHWARMARGPKWPLYNHYNYIPRHWLVPKLESTHRTIPRHICHCPFCRWHNHTWRTNNIPRA
jgi:hypothetical protein